MTCGVDFSMTTNSRLGTGNNTVRWIVLDFEHSKVVKPAQKKQAIEHMIGQGLCSVRRACHYLGLHRSTYRYRPRQPPPQQFQLYQRIVALSWHYPRYGYRRIRALLAQ